MTKSVQISKGLLWALGSALGVALLALAFLLGRQSAAPEKALNVALSSAAPQAEATHPTPLPSQAPAPNLRAPATHVSPIFEPEKATQGQWGSPDQHRSAVAAYFRALDQIQPEQFSGDAQSMAQEMAAAMAKGDTSGLDKLLKQAQATKGRLTSISVPPPCAHHHRESLNSLEDGLSLLQSIKQALGNSDPGALMSMATQATAMKKRAEALQGEEQRLREFYGVGK